MSLITASHYELSQQFKLLRKQKLLSSNGAVSNRTTQFLELIECFDKIAKYQTPVVFYRNT